MLKYYRDRRPSLLKTGTPQTVHLPGEVAAPIGHVAVFVGTGWSPPLGAFRVAHRGGTPSTDRTVRNLGQSDRVGLLRRRLDRPRPRSRLIRMGHRPRPQRRQPPHPTPVPGTLGRPPTSDPRRDVRDRTERHDCAHCVPDAGRSGRTDRRRLVATRTPRRDRRQPRRPRRPPPRLPRLGLAHPRRHPHLRRPRRHRRPVRNWPHNWWTTDAAARRAGCDSCGVGVTIVDEAGTRWTYCHGSQLTTSAGRRRDRRPTDPLVRRHRPLRRAPPPPRDPSRRPTAMPAAVDHDAP